MQPAKRCIMIVEVMHSTCSQLDVQFVLWFAHQIWFGFQQSFYFSLLCPHSLAALLIFFAHTNDRNVGVSLLYSGVTLSHGSDHVWGHTDKFLYIIEAKHFGISELICGAEKRSRENMMKGKRAAWGGCDLNPREGESHTEIRTGKSGLSSSCIWVEKYVGLNHLIHRPVCHCYTAGGESSCHRVDKINCGHNGLSLIKLKDVVSCLVWPNVEAYCGVIVLLNVRAGSYRLWLFLFWMWYYIIRVASVNLHK